MKKFKILLVLCSLFLGISSVNAMASGKRYGIYVTINGNKESLSVYSEHSMANGAIAVNVENVTFNNIPDNSYVSFENYDGDIYNINLSLNGESKLDVINAAGFGGTITVSGSGSVRFKPVTQTEGGREVPDLVAGGVPVYYIDDVEEQKSWVQNRIITDLPVTYSDGYVCINCSSKIDNDVVSDNSHVTNTSDEEKPGNDNTLMIIGFIGIMSLGGVSFFVVEKMKKKK